MQPVTFQGIEVDKCTSCGGLWFDILEEEHLRKLSGSDAIDTGDEQVGQDKNQIGRIRCPKEATPMVRMVVTSQPHIHYESCSVCHGTYFDAGEFKDFAARTFVDAIKAVFSRERT
jgi:Zn-finger nucleic acid-binding protein